MRKEVLIAILLGSAIGLAIAFGIWRANKAFLPQRKEEATQSPSITQVVEDGENEDGKDTGPLVITSPENNLVVGTGKISIEGVSTENATIVITTNIAENILQTGSDGKFKGDIELEGGVNLIKVVSYDKTGNKTEKSLTIVYSTEFES
jgi:hypothetical protein